MDRLTIFKNELEIVKNLRCLSFSLKEKVIEHYEHEIRCIEEYGCDNRYRYSNFCTVLEKDTECSRKLTGFTEFKTDDLVPFTCIPLICKNCEHRAKNTTSCTLLEREIEATEH